MSNITIGGIVVFLLLFVISRGISDRALKRLDKEHNEKLMDIHSRHRKVYVIPLVVIFLVYFFTARFLTFNTESMLLAVYILLCFYVLSVNLFMYVQLRRAALPQGYLRSYLLSKLITFAGLCILVVSLLVGGGW